MSAIECSHKQKLSLKSIYRQLFCSRVGLVICWCYGGAMVVLARICSGAAPVPSEHLFLSTTDRTRSGRLDVFQAFFRLLLYI